MALMPNDSRNAYVQIADDLRRQIQSGDFAPGDKLPSTVDLVKKYDVANMTVQGAFRLLREESLIYSVQGRGTFVRDDVVVGEIVRNDEGPTADYLALRGQVETLLAAIGDLDQRVRQIEEIQKNSDVNSKQ